MGGTISAIEVADPNSGGRKKTEEAAARVAMKGDFQFIQGLAVKELNEYADLGFGFWQWEESQKGSLYIYLATPLSALLYCTYTIFQKRIGVVNL